MSNKSYKSNSSWDHSYNNQPKTNKNNSVPPIQNKEENQAENDHDWTQDPAFKPNAMINNVRRSIEAGNYPKNAAPIQPKLTIGAPGDKYEQEADQVASQVVQRINASATPPNDDGDDNPIQRKPSIPILQRSSYDYNEINRKAIEAELQRKDYGLTAPNIQADFENNLYHLHLVSIKLLNVNGISTGDR